MNMVKKKEGFAGQRSAILPAELLKQLAAHPLCEALYITDIGHYPKAAFHDRERRRGSPQHILIYCVHGNGWYQIDKQTHVVSANQFFILPANVAHRYGADLQNPWTIYWVHFTGSRSVEYLKFLNQFQDGQPIIVPPRDERFHLFDDIIGHVEMSFNEDNMVYANHALAHFLTTFNHSVYRPAERSSTEQDPIGRTIAYMRQKLDKTLTLEELAQVAGMSTSHYSTVFRKKVQSAPINFFTFLKIQHACRLLQDTSLRIKDVAYQIGYEDPYYFSRVFTSVMGTSPRQFRSTKKNG
jgi:AraC family transcriptional regulator, arabinose operon regulatory protein